MRDEVTFFRNGERVEVRPNSPSETLLDYLRLREGRTGTKEGCCEGDCGACTVVLGRPGPDGIEYSPINSCIFLLGMIDGAELITVEDLSTDTQLHPVQQAMIDSHGAQCGFCTPGFVMSLFSLYHDKTKPNREKINNALAGNLCRCTGYRPIVDAAFDACTGAPDDAYSKRAKNIFLALQEFSTLTDDIFIGDETEFFAAPASLTSLLTVLERHPNTTLIGGATDVGLWVTKHLTELPQIAWLGRVKELQDINVTDKEITIGATVTYQQAAEVIGNLHPDLEELWRRIGSLQVRASGTIGGNIANGSPIGDTPPPLIALNTTITLQSTSGVRDMPLEDFFIRYGKQDLKPGEIVKSITIPKPTATSRFFCRKISKRYDQDITASLGAFYVELSGGKVSAARLAFGGMSETPRRALKTEKEMIGLKIDNTSALSQAVEKLADDFTPITDMRASADYRLDVAKQLLLRFVEELHPDAA